MSDPDRLKQRLFQRLFLPLSAAQYTTKIRLHNCYYPGDKDGNMNRIIPYHYDWAVELAEAFI